MNKENQKVTQSDLSCPIFALIEQPTSELSDEELEVRTIKIRSLLETPQSLKKVLGGIKGKTRAKTKKKKPSLDSLDLGF